MDGAKPLRLLRIDAGLSQVGLSKRTCQDGWPKPVHPLTINSIENHGSRPYPSTMKRLADALGVPITSVKEFQRVRRHRTRKGQKAD